MKNYIRKHENYCFKNIEEEKTNLEDLLQYHLQQIKWLQHERLVHLLVMLFTAFLLILSFTALYITGSILMFFICLILLILTIFYVFHYYYLENTVQKWYKISNLINEKITGTAVNTLKL